MGFQEFYESKGMGMLTQQKRLFYPRNFNLSPGFLAALEKEFKFQSKHITPEQFIQKISKAIQFHVSEYKKKPGKTEPENPHPTQVKTA